MKCKELVYLAVSARFFEEKINFFTQKGLAEELDVSLSTINNAIKPLKRMSAVKVKQRGFNVTNFEKLMAYWATVRDVKKDIVYSTFVSERIDKIEAGLASNSILTAYSAYRRLEEAPADYSEAYFYSGDLEEIKKRFPEKKGPFNLFAIQTNPLIEKLSKNNLAPLPLIFVDLWNLPEWYAKDYLEKAKKKLFG